MKLVIKLSLCIAALFISAQIIEAKTDSRAAAPVSFSHIYCGSVESVSAVNVSDYFLLPSSTSATCIQHNLPTAKVPTIFGTKLCERGVETILCFDSSGDNPVTYRYSRQSNYYIYTLKQIRI